MKKLYTLFMVSSIALASRAQLVIKENFTGYTNGNLGTQGGWTTTNGSPDVQVASATPLTYTGYNAGGAYITVSDDNGKEPYKTFLQTVSTNNVTRTFYMSFLVRVSSAVSSNFGEVYSLALFNTGNSARPLRFYIAEDQNNTNRVRFGITTGSSSTVAYTPSSNQNNSIYRYNTTYLIVVRYDVVNGSNNNDVAYLWVNPNTVTEPATNAANATKTGANETNFGAQLNALEVSQQHNFYSPVAAYDAIEVAANASSSVAWALITAANATLPVTLTSFNAAQDGVSNTKLVWNVSNESGIESYIIEKSTDGRNFTAIGTVAATGQTNYSFTDAQATSDYTYYRLKWVEADGSYKISYIVSLKSKLSTSITLSPNPVKNSLMIQHPKVTGEAKVQLINAGGQFIKEYRLSAGAVISTIDMSGLTSGLYHVVYKNGTDVFTKTVLKQ